MARSLGLVLAVLASFGASPTTACTGAAEGVRVSGSGADLAYVSVARVKIRGTSARARDIAERTAQLKAGVLLFDEVPESWRAADGKALRGVIDRDTCIKGQWVVSSAKISQESVDNANLLLATIQDSLEDNPTPVKELAPES